MVAEILERQPYDETRPWLLQASCKPLKYHLNDYQRNILLERYDACRGNISSLMRHFPGVPRWRVRKWAAEMGLARVKEPRWSADDLAFLKDSLGVLTVKQIAKRLGRTETAVKVKAKRLHISVRLSDGYTLRGLCEGLGVDHHKVERWVDRGWLRGRRIGTDRTKTQLGDIWQFTDRNIYELVRDHPGEIDPRRVEWLWLVDILISHGR